jgi:beta-lactamase superfamily II metal-dependent hydrolase
VIYATAKDNRFGFPKAEVKARYDVIGAQQFDTGGEGAVRVCLCAEELEIETLRTTQARRWRMPHESPMP